MYVSYLFIALAEKDTYSCSQEKQQKGKNGSCREAKTVTSKQTLAVTFSRTVCAKQKQNGTREPELWKEQFCCTERLPLCDERYFCYDFRSNTYQLI